MVDATYYFTVPITNRRGTFEILPSRTFGTQYEGYVAIGTATLDIGGPDKSRTSVPEEAHGHHDDATSTWTSS